VGVGRYLDRLKVLKKEPRRGFILHHGCKLVNCIFYLHPVTTHLALGCDVHSFITFQRKV